MEARFAGGSVNANKDDWRTIADPNTGERLVFEVTGAESNGAFVRARGFVAPHARGPQRHRHRRHSETFTVVNGRLTVEVAGQMAILGPGESVTAAAGEAHTFRNETDEEVELVGEARPAAHFEEGLRAIYGLGRDGRMGPINLALAARLAESLPAGPPAPIARILVAIMAWIGDRLGRDGCFPEYTQPPRAATTQQ
ncbi:MAG TPA: cupin domain-containing protein [Ktedonobacterales bacterium]|nr:cupin domain-containing protein [Ktedonobacterales bacterium]